VERAVHALQSAVCKASHKCSPNGPRIQAPNVDARLVDMRKDQAARPVVLQVFGRAWCGTSPALLGHTIEDILGSKIMGIEGSTGQPGPI